MCHPVVAFGFSALTTVAQQVGKERQAEAAYAYQLDKRQRTLAVAADAVRTEYSGIQNRLQEASAAAAQDLHLAQIDHQKAQSKLTVSPAAGNVSGGTVKETGFEFKRRYTDTVAIQEANMSNTQRQILGTFELAHSKAMGRFDGSTFEPIFGANNADLFAGFVDAGLGAHSMYPDHSFFGGKA